MKPAWELQTHMTETVEELIIRLSLPGLEDSASLFVEDFGNLLRVRGQTGSTCPRAFAKSIPIPSGQEPPKATLHDGILSIRVKRPPQDMPSTIPNTIS